MTEHTPTLPDDFRADVPVPAAARSRPGHKEPDQIGPFRILEKVGEGGMGLVYRAEQREPVRRVVALKVIKLGMDTKEVVARFEAERQALALLSHPNVARVFEAGMTGQGRPFFAMEYVAGIPLTQYCDENMLTARQRIELFVPVCHAVQHAHQKGIIHRDLKPSNILVTLMDGQAVPKVIDFGIAKATNQALTQHTLFTQTGALIGTPEYMSPEQAMTSGLDVDTRTDVYSLGVILYELLTGSLPIDPKSLRSAGFEGMARLIKTAEPQKPSTRLVTRAGDAGAGTLPGQSQSVRQLQKELKGDLDWIILKAMEKDRSRRYETANGLAADLNRHLNNEPVTARPPSTMYRFQKAFRRNRLAFTAAVIVVATLLVGVGISSWQAIAATRARGEAVLAKTRAEDAQSVAEAAQKRADVQAHQASESREQSRRLLYAADMNLAQQSLKLNNLGRARRLLDRHRPRPGEEDLRGWEWRYLWQLTRSSALATLATRPIRGFSVSFSPDGAHLAVGWYDGRVDLWNVPQRQLSRILSDHESAEPGRVAFSPVGNLLAATAAADVVKLHDLDSGRERVLWRGPEQGRSNVRDLHFSRDGARLVIYAGGLERRDGGDAAWVVNVADGRVDGHFPAPFSSHLHCGAAQISPDGQRLYLSRSDAANYHYTIQCIDLSTNRELWQTPSQRDVGLTTLAVSPDGKLLACGSGFEDPSIRIWDASDGRLVVRLDGHTAWVAKLQFSNDGRELLSAASDQTIRIWDTRTWTESGVLRGHTDEIHALAVSEAAKLIASASKDGRLMLWSLDQQGTTEGYRRIPEPLADVEGQFGGDSRVLLLPANRPPLIVDMGRPAMQLPLPGVQSSANVLGWFGRNSLASWDGSGRIEIRELQGTEWTAAAAVPINSSARPIGTAFNANQRLLAWSEPSSPASVFVEKLSTPGRRIELKSDLVRPNPWLFSGDGVYLMVSRGDDTSKGLGALRVWNVDEGQVVASVGKSAGEMEKVEDAIFFARDRKLAVTTQDAILFFDLATPGQAPRRIPAPRMILLAKTADETLLAATSLSGQVRLYDAAKGELIEAVHGHMNASFGIAFSPDQKRLISASGGREAVKLWDVGTRQELLALSGTGSTLSWANWSDDGKLIIVGAPWQAWRAPSWDEIAAAEAKDRTEIQTQSQR